MASLSANRNARRATKRNSTTMTKTISPVVIAGNIAIGLTRTTAYCLLPTAYCLLPTAYCLLPTAFRVLPSVIRAHGRFDVPAHVKVAFDLDAQRIAGFHKVFEHDVDYVLVKNLHVAE